MGSVGSRIGSRLPSSIECANTGFSHIWGDFLSIIASRARALPVFHTLSNPPVESTLADSIAYSTGYRQV
ncbi:hypothetical protein RSOLAG1IB_09299 [Rhizoctonia solani AG-1 IB]|uniref:Uncharacterized protein n=1 Tax=Thanatephorus cucumeris (strain AG1-IB / isolate 7/3/14) TaxID=1108050 RepID=A0A0B7FQ22_THACB|nr:hypothetical protein RSOLAG1IB_09299 [Rhizoctonia solani AG-1 IB]